MPRRRYYGNQQGENNRPRVIVRYVDNTPLAESTPEMQWLVNGIIRMGIMGSHPLEHPHELAQALVDGHDDLGIAYADKLRWLHNAPAENNFAQSVKRFFGSTGRISEGQLACCRDLAPGETPRRGMSARPAAPVAPMRVETLPEPPRYVAPAPVVAPPPPPPRTPRPTRVLASAPNDTGWSETTIRALWGGQADTVIAELRGNGITVGE